MRATRSKRPATWRSGLVVSTCDVEITIEVVDGLYAPDVSVRHDDHCPLLRTMQVRPPGLGRWQAVLRRG
jgi:hypothetical protein